MNVEKSFHSIETHVAGEPFRIVIHSPITLDGDSIETKMALLKHNFTNEKNLLLNEPRGHRGMHGCIVTSSSLADVCLLFFQHENVNRFKYEGVIAAVSALLETGYLQRREGNIYKVETVNGIQKVKATIGENNKISSIYIENKQTSVKPHQDNHMVEIDNARNYALVTLPEDIPGIELDHLASIERFGKKLTTELTEANVNYNGIIVFEMSKEKYNKIRSVTFETDGYILRSPGIDSTIAVLHFLSEKNNELTDMTNESIFGSIINAKKIANSKHQYGVEAKGFLMGIHQFVFDKDDPLENGFLLK